jgi:hypothetical protein
MLAFQKLNHLATLPRPIHLGNQAKHGACASGREEAAELHPNLRYRLCIAERSNNDWAKNEGNLLHLLDALINKVADLNYITNTKGRRVRLVA